MSNNKKWLNTYLSIDQIVAILKAKLEQSKARKIRTVGNTKFITKQSKMNRD